MFEKNIFANIDAANFCKKTGKTSQFKNYRKFSLKKFSQISSTNNHTRYEKAKTCRTLPTTTPHQTNTASHRRYSWYRPGQKPCSAPSPFWVRTATTCDGGPRGARPVASTSAPPPLTPSSDSYKSQRSVRPNGEQAKNIKKTKMPRA